MGCFSYVYVGLTKFGEYYMEKRLCFFIWFTIFGYGSANRGLNYTNINVDGVFVFTVGGLANVYVRRGYAIEKGKVVWSNINSDAVLIGMVMDSLSLIFSYGYFSIFTGVMFLSKFIDMPSNGRNAIFASVMVVSFVFSGEVLCRVSLESNSRVVVFTFSHVPTTPTISRFIGVVNLFIGFRGCVFNSNFVVVTMGPMVTIFCGFSQYYSVEFLGYKYVSDEGATNGRRRGYDRGCRGESTG